MKKLATSHQGRKSLWQMLLIATLSLCILLITVSQYIASYYTYDPALGQSLYGTLYSPHRAITWTYKLATINAAMLISGWLLGVAVSLSSALGLVAVHHVTTRTRKASAGHGSARWADEKDMEKAGLIKTPTNKTSLIVGGYKNPNTNAIDYLTHTGPESVLVYAPSRSGKGVSLVIPNLLCFEGSCFVVDVKGELWEHTAGYRRDGLSQKVLFHNPSSEDPGNAKFNVLDEIRVSENTAVRDTQLIAQYLIPSSKANNSEGASSNSDHFESAARSLLVGVVLYELNRCESFAKRVITVTSVLGTVTDPELEFREYLEIMQSYENTNCSYCNVIREIATEMQNRDDREFDSVLSSMVNPLSIYRDPILANATSRSDFCLTDLVSGESPISLYAIISPSEAERLKNYFGMLVNLLCRKLTERTPRQVANESHTLLLLLDEFSKLPPLPIVQDSLDLFAGYRIKAMIIVHDVQTLTRLYGRNETIQTNCKVRIAFTPNKYETAEMLSKMVGSSTVQEKTENRQRKAMAIVESSISEAEGLHSRQLLTADEVMRLDVPVLDVNERMIHPGASLVFVTGCRPIKGVQTPFFMDSELAERAAYICPLRSDHISRAEHLPTTTNHHTSARVSETHTSCVSDVVE